MASQAGVLWMGSLEWYMDEVFIRSAFSRMRVEISEVKMMTYKFTGAPACYCFVHFRDDSSALSAMHKLNNKVIPNSHPTSKFRLNHSSLRGKQALDKYWSLWVGDLSPDVDDFTLYKGFASRYSTVILATVIRDVNGFSKGFGFVRFAEEGELKDALMKMNGLKGIGSKALRVQTNTAATNRADGGPKRNDPLQGQGQAIAAAQANNFRAASQLPVKSDSDSSDDSEDDNFPILDKKGSLQLFGFPNSGISNGSGAKESVAISSSKSYSHGNDQQRCRNLNYYSNHHNNNNYASNNYQPLKSNHPNTHNYRGRNAFYPNQEHKKEYSNNNSRPSSPPHVVTSALYSSLAKRDQHRRVPMVKTGRVLKPTEGYLCPRCKCRFVSKSYRDLHKYTLKCKTIVALNC